MGRPSESARPEQGGRWQLQQLQLVQTPAQNGAFIEALNVMNAFRARVGGWLPQAAPHDMLPLLRITGLGVAGLPLPRGQEPDVTRGESRRCQSGRRS